MRVVIGSFSRTWAKSTAQACSTTTIQVGKAIAQKYKGFIFDLDCLPEDTDIRGMGGAYIRGMKHNTEDEMISRYKSDKRFRRWMRVLYDMPYSSALANATAGFIYRHGWE
jgi:hypothetical protein